MAESWRGANSQAARESPRRKPAVVRGMETPPRRGKKLFLINPMTIAKRTIGHHDFRWPRTAFAHGSSCLPLYAVVLHDSTPQKPRSNENRRDLRADIHHPTASNPDCQFSVGSGPSSGVRGGWGGFGTASETTFPARISMVPCSTFRTMRGPPPFTEP